MDLYEARKKVVDKFINDFIQYKIGNPMNWRNTLHIKCWAVVAALVGGGNFVSAQVAAVPDRAYVRCGSQVICPYQTFKFSFFFVPGKMPPFRRLFSYVAEVKQQISSCFCTKQRKSGFSRKTLFLFHGMYGTIGTSAICA